MPQNPHVLLTFDKVHSPLRLPRKTTSEHPKLFRTWCVLYILTWKCASRHNGVTFSSLVWPDGSAPAALASLLFDPPEPQIIGKTQCFANFLPFRAPGSSFFGDFLFLDLLSSFLLSDSSHLCFSFIYIVGSLTSKFPSNSSRRRRRSGGCGWKCYKTLTFCSLLTRCWISCAGHAKRHLNVQKWSNMWCL